MLVAITSDGTTLDAKVDSRFGRCALFLIIDTKSGTFEAIDNAQNLNAPQGAGIQAAEHVVNHGAQAVLTGHCGPKAFRVLTAGEVQIYLGVEGTVREALAAFTSGTLKRADNADVEGHW